MAAHVCPLWMGYLLASPLRKLFQNPEKIVGPHIEEDMTVLDIGCAMGFFSLPLARLVGPGGKVICVDVQQKMIKSLERRAKRADLMSQIETRLCRRDSLGLDDLDGQIDFVLAFAVVHEVPDASTFFSEVHRTLKAFGKALVAEPRGRVSRDDFARLVSIAEQNSFDIAETPLIRRSLAVLLSKK